MPPRIVRLMFVFPKQTFPSEIRTTLICREKLRNRIHVSFMYLNYFHERNVDCENVIFLEIA